jgi:hypothetical protein
MAAALALLGIVIIGIGAIWMLIVAFQESVLWGLGCLIVPFVSLVFLVMFWSRAKNPFFVQLAGVVIMAIGMAMGGVPVPEGATTP